MPSLDHLGRTPSVFITGASGFIGHALARHYRNLGCEVKGVDVVADSSAGIVAGDIATPGPWQNHAADCDILIHTAAIVSNSAPKDLCWRVNVLGTRHALEAAVSGGAQRFVHFSSVRAFSDVDFPNGVDESFPVRPDGHRYVDTKIASEQVVLQAHASGEINGTIIRPGDVYGPGSKPWTLWPALTIPSGDFFIPDDGGGIFSPVYIDNLVDGVALAAESTSGIGEVFTISDGFGVTNLEFFGHYFRMLGKEPALLPADDLRRRFDEQEHADLDAGRVPLLNGETVDYFLRRGTYSIDKARRLLGFEPQVGLGLGMRKTEHWLQSIGLVGATVMPVDICE